VKTLTIPTVILAAILIFSLWTGRYVEERTDNWATQLKETGESAGSGDWEEASTHLDRIYADWSDSQTFFHTIMEHEELDQAEDLFAGAFAMCREENAGEFHMFLARLMVQMEALAETQRMGLKNIL